MTANTVKGLLQYIIDSLVNVVDTFTPTYVSPVDQTTTSAYADVEGSVIDTYSKTKLSYVIKNTHAANSIKWKVMRSNDNITYVEGQAEETVAALATSYYSTTAAAYRYYKIQVLVGSGSNQGTAQVRGYAKF